MARRSWKERVIKREPEAFIKKDDNGRWVVRVGANILADAAGAAPAWEKAYWKLVDRARAAASKSGETA